MGWVGLVGRGLRDVGRHVAASLLLVLQSPETLQRAAQSLKPRILEAGARLAARGGLGADAGRTRADS